MAWSMRQDGDPGISLSFRTRCCSSERVWPSVQPPSLSFECCSWYDLGVIFCFGEVKFLLQS